MHPTQNTLPEAVRSQSVEVLNLHLAAAIDLHGQVKQAHWNVRGPGFFAVHTLFDSVSEAVEGFSDDLAERAGALGGTAYGTIQTAAERSFLLPYPLAIVAAFGDADTADLLTEISRGIDKQLWFIESHAAPK